MSLLPSLALLAILAVEPAAEPASVPASPGSVPAADCTFVPSHADPDGRLRREALSRGTQALRRPIP